MGRMALTGKEKERSEKERLKYIREFTAENYDRFSMLRTKGDKEKLKKIATDNGMKLNEFINYCIDKELKERGIDLYKM